MTSLDNLTFNAYRAARREQVACARSIDWRGYMSDADRGAAHRAMRLARDRAADFTEAERQLAAARAALANVADKRRYATEYAAARAALESCTRRWNVAWRRVRAGRIWRKPSPVRAGTAGPGTVYLEQPGSMLRFVGAAHDIVRVGHTGWYLDDEDGVTIHGVVYQLPAQHGSERYLAGHSDAHNPGAASLSLEILDDKDDAARAADAMAERVAADEREYQDAWRAGQAHRDARRDLLAQGVALVAAARDLRAAFRRRHDAARDARAIKSASLACFGLDGAALAADARQRGAATLAMIRASVAPVRDARGRYLEARRDVAHADTPPRPDPVYAAFWDGYAG